MSLIHAVEHHLGPIDTWPSYILRFLFVHYVTTNAVKKVAAFFFGNDVPLDITKPIYRLCNDTYSQDTEMQIDHFYRLWQSSYYKKHMASYYNMLHQTFIWINGRALHQLETQEPEVTVMDFGIANTQCKSQIQAKLKIILGEEDV
jgi:hypothetical protein